MGIEYDLPSVRQSSVAPGHTIVLRDYWPVAPDDLRESLLVALATPRLPAANDFLLGLIATRDPSARAALSALTIYRHNPKMIDSIAAAVEANGEE